MFEFTELSKSFGPKKVLDRLTFAVRPGELFGFCGANGAGKTTAMRIALGLLPPDGGQVSWNGRRLDAERRRRIGYMPEERGLYGRMRPLDQLVYFARLSGVPRSVAQKRAAAWIDRLGVVMGKDDTLEKLSLGNQQKIQLIAAVIHDPDVLVLDEPFSGLDPVASDDMAKALTEFTGNGVPVLFSSHQLDLVERLCHRVGIIRQGRMVAEGTVADLRQAGSGRRYEIRVVGAPRGWAQRLPVGRVVREDGGPVLVDVDPGVPAGAVLAAAQSIGEVDHFARHDPTLTEIFRKVVAA